MISFQLGPYNPDSDEMLERSFRLLDRTIRPWAENVRIEWIDREERKHYIFVTFKDEGWTGYVLSNPNWKTTFISYKKLNEVLE